MLKALMALALRERPVVIGLAVILVLAGVYSFSQLDIEAYPDPVQPMVEVLTLPAGLSAEEVEQQITVPLEFGLAGMLNLEAMRSISLFGLSDIRCYFTWSSDYYWDRHQTIDRLGFVTMPPGVAPGISPENPIGEIYRYVIDSPDHDLIKQKVVEDWIVEKQLKTVPGVLDVSGFGGLTKQYHVDVDPAKLVYYNIPLSSLITALQNSNRNAGGNYLSVGEQAFDVRGLGLIHSLADIRNVTLAVSKATPIHVSDVAAVSVGYAPRLGIVGMNDRDDIVEGIVLMRKYGNTVKTLRGVEAKVRSLNESGALPRGYRIEPYYDRSSLVNTTIRTVMENLTAGMVLVFLVLVFLLGNMRAALIAAVNIPLALCGAFALMYAGDTPANLISLGAIDFGIIIDSTVIVMENIHRVLAAHHAGAPGYNVRARILSAAQEVGGPIFFSTLIFVIAFLPLFTMRGVEGVIFGPMSHTYAYALATAILLAVTLSPVLSSFALRGGVGEPHNPVWNAVSRLYHRFFQVVVRRSALSVAVIGAALVVVLSMFSRVGGQFMPKLEEGNIWARATLPLSVSLDQAALMGNRMRRAFMAFPEVSNVVSQVGRPDDGTETTGFFNVEFSVDLKPFEQWPSGLTKPELVSRINARLTHDFPGVSFGYSQNIEDNVNEALSGVKGSNSVKVFGPHLRQDEHIAYQVMDLLRRVPGMTDVAVYRSLGQPNVLIRPKREQCARYGLNVGDVTDVVQAAVGGEAVTQVLQGDQRFDLVVRWQKPYRTSLDALRRIRVNLPGGGEVPLVQVADIRTAGGASFVYREDFQRYVPLRFAVRGRDFQTTVNEARQLIAREIRLPRGVRLEWAGQFAELRQANRRLMVVVPIALLLIAGVLYWATASFVDTFVILAQIPVACTGGVLALLLTGTPFSVSAAVGFISIFGIATMDGILLSFYIHQLWEEGHPFAEAIVLGSDRRLRATMMTDLVDALGLLPAALSTKIGAQTQRPLAIVVIGGALAIMVLTRLFQPALIHLCHRRMRRDEAASA